MQLGDVRSASHVLRCVNGRAFCFAVALVSLAPTIGIATADTITWNVSGGVIEKSQSGAALMTTFQVGDRFVGTFSWDTSIAGGLPGAHSTVNASLALSLSGQPLLVSGPFEYGFSQPGPSGHQSYFQFVISPSSYTSPALANGTITPYQLVLRFESNVPSLPANPINFLANTVVGPDIFVQVNFGTVDAVSIASIHLLIDSIVVDLATAPSAAREILGAGLDALSMTESAARFCDAAHSARTFLAVEQSSPSIFGATGYRREEKPYVADGLARQDTNCEGLGAGVWQSENASIGLVGNLVRSGARVEQGSIVRTFQGEGLQFSAHGAFVDEGLVGALQIDYGQIDWDFQGDWSGQRSERVEVISATASAGYEWIVDGWSIGVGALLRVNNMQCDEACFETGNVSSANSVSGEVMVGVEATEIKGSMLPYLSAFVTDDLSEGRQFTLYGETMRFQTRGSRVGVNFGADFPLSSGLAGFLDVRFERGLEAEFKSQQARAGVVLSL
jgi:hypothetical protein